MPLHPQQLKEKIKLINDLYTDGLTRTDFERAFKELTNLIIRIESDFVKKYNRLGLELQTLAQEIKSDNSSTFNDFRRKIIDRLAQLKDGYTPIKGKDYVDGKDPDEKKIISDVLAQIKFPEQILDGPKEIRNKLSILKGDERLDKSAIKGLEDEIKKLREEITRIPRAKGGSRKIPMLRVIDLTANVDGSATTFNLPRDVVRVHMVWSTQFPIILRPDVDFTLAGQTLTLVQSQVGIMQSGQTVSALIETLFYQF